MPLARGYALSESGKRAMGLVVELSLLCLLRVHSHRGCMLSVQHEGLTSLQAFDPQQLVTAQQMKVGARPTNGPVCLGHAPRGSCPGSALNGARSS